MYTFNIHLGDMKSEVYLHGDKEVMSIINHGTVDFIAPSRSILRKCN